MLLYRRYAMSTPAQKRANAKYREAHRETAKEASRLDYELNKVAIRERHKEYYNRTKVLKRDRPQALDVITPMDSEGL
jgi:hypothetical protein